MKTRPLLICVPALLIAASDVAVGGFDDIVDDVAPLSFYLGTPPDTLQIRYYANHPLDALPDTLTRAVVVIHGTLRNSNDYFQAILDAAEHTTGSDSTSLIVAPQFLTAPDLEEHDLPEDMLFWEYMGWRQGDLSLDTIDHPRPWRISSYAVADTILYRIVQQCPALADVVLVGHSAGGQFVNRFAAGSQMHELLTDHFDVDVRYVVSNPSSYLYLDDERWRGGTAYDFSVPDGEALEACQEYNDYKFGLDNPNEYMSIGEEVIRQQYSNREVIYLLGEYDDDPESPYLDVSCPAMFEGIHRLQRGILYANHLADVFGEAILELHRIALVEGVGHNHHAMFTSECGVHYIFDFGDCSPIPLSAEWADVTTAPLIVKHARGAAWGDYDGDRHTDLYVAGGLDANILLHNEGDGGYRSVALPPSGSTGDALVGKWGDYDNDADLDLYLVYATSGNRLLRNDGAGAFSDVTTGPLVGGDFMSDAAWADFDNDGDLDLYLGRTHGHTNMLLRNEGGGDFSDVTSGALADTGGTNGVTWADYDGDGDMDLYLANQSANRLLRNDGWAEFTDVTTGCLGDTGISSGGVWGDCDNDGDLDLYVSNRGSPNRLLRNDGDALFTDITKEPVADPMFTWSASWGDYDNDGWLDLYVANAYSKNRLLRNEGGALFSDSTRFPLGDRGNSFSATWTDDDNDGRLDLYLANHLSCDRLFRNSAGSGNHWLHLDLQGTDSNAFGVGARIRVVANGLTQIRQVGAGEAGPFAQNSLTAEFGLGPAAWVDTLRILWPSGIEQEFLRVDADRRLVIEETDIYIDAGEDGGIPVVVGLAEYPNPFSLTTTIEYGLSRPMAASLSIYDVSGRRVRLLTRPAVQPAGRYRVFWDGRGENGEKLASGVYYCRLQAGSSIWRRNLLLIR